MSGFKLTLKGKGNTKPKPLGSKPLGIKLAGSKRSAVTQKSSVLANSDSESDSEKTYSIDSFDKGKGGGIKGSRAVDQKPKQAPLVIKIDQTIDWKDKLKARAKKEAENTKSNTATQNTDHSEEDTLIRQSLVSGEPVLDSSNGLSIKIKSPSSKSAEEQDEDSQDEGESYGKVSVEQFGAAMLRGMGWQPSKKQKTLSATDKAIENRKRGDLLGIGAKEVESDLMLGKKSKFEIPIVRREKNTGKTE